MAGKKHGKKKRFQPVNRPKAELAQTGAIPTLGSAAPTAASPVAKAAPAPKAAPAGKGGSAGSKVISYEYFGKDLKSIGILMAVIVVVLIILGIVLK
ncbi:MAG TPA: hypothetical protein VMB24_04570 [Dehalococcoidales bacterium]|nr:hypothetical protein [Dehalococcoidales bacterium]